MQFELVDLIGQRVQLEPLAPAHREPLRLSADDERIWRHMVVDARGAGFDTWFTDALAQRDEGHRWPYAVRCRQSGALLGSTSFLDPVVRHRRLEIGSTWYVPAVWGTAVNPECKLLLLTHAFEILGAHRVQFVTDALNERSQAAIAKLGAQREGVLRSHMISRSARVRDSVVFSLIASEWPQAKSNLKARLAAFPAA